MDVFELTVCKSTKLAGRNGTIPILSSKPILMYCKPDQSILFNMGLFRILSEDRDLGRSML